MEKLPIEFKEKWVAALRSGEYKQAQSQLASLSGGYCCLGLACKIAGHSDGELVGLGFIADESIEDEREGGIHWLFSDKVPELIKGNGDVAYRLQQMNDVAKKSFSEIADWIEANL